MPSKAAPENTGLIDLNRSVPAYLTWISNALTRGASQTYLRLFDVGIGIWRCLILLAIHHSVSAQQVSKIIGLDKAAVSRCFKRMRATGLINLGLDAGDGRLRKATLTPRGRALHDRIREVAFERERALLSVLSVPEREALIQILKRLHETCPPSDARRRVTSRGVTAKVARKRRR